MKLITAFDNINQLNFFENIKTDIILRPRSLSRRGNLNKKELEIAAKGFRKQNKKVILEWDILMVESVFKIKTDFFDSLDLSLFDAVRVQDPGALYHVLNSTNINIQLITETGNHNIKGLKGWRDLVGQRLDCLIVSSELNYKTLLSYKENLDCPLEVLAFGPLLLFYTPRSLVSPHLSNINQQEKIVNVTSEESPHKGFEVVENIHGTFMYYPKDLCLIDKTTELNELDINYRIELSNRPIEFLETIINLFNNYSQPEYQNFKENYNRPIIRGFFGANKTDVLFTKLKNHRLNRVDKTHIGKIKAVERNSYLILGLEGEQDLEINQEIEILTPEGKIINHIVHSMSDIENNPLEKVAKTNILLPYIKGVVPQSVVRFT